MPLPPRKSSRNKQTHIIAEIKQMAHNLGPGEKLKKAQELADQFGVTVTTLDRALAKLESMNIIRRKQGSGIYVSPHLYKKRIGLVLGKNWLRLGTSPFFMQLLINAEMQAQVEDHLFSFYLLKPSHQSKLSEPVENTELENSIRRGRLDGLILQDVNDPEEHTWFSRQPLPCISLSPCKQFPSIHLDKQKLIEIAVTELVDQGAKTLGLMGDHPSHHTHFIRIAREHGATIEDYWVSVPEGKEKIPNHAHESYGRRWMDKCLTRRDKIPDGIVFTDDVLARGPLFSMTTHGIEIGKNILVASHSYPESLALEYWRDQIILVEFDTKMIAEKMLTLIESLIDHKPFGNWQTDISPTLRKSQPAANRLLTATLKDTRHE